MKYLYILILFLFSACLDLNKQSTKKGKIITELSNQIPKDKIAISNGQDIFLITSDSIINDSTTLPLYFICKEFDSNGKIYTKYHNGLFTIYEAEIQPVMRGSSYYAYKASNGEKSIYFNDLNLSTNNLKVNEKIIIIWKGDVTYPTYKTIN
jgi:outer membrane protein assembly factor BamB